MSLESFTQAQALERWENQKDKAFIPTGIDELDSVIGGGLPVHQITTVIGTTGSGKSEFTRQARRFAAAHGYRVIHADVELGVAIIIQRDLAQEAKIPFSRMRSGPFTPDEERRLAEAKRRLVDDTNVVSVEVTCGTRVESVLDTVSTLVRRLPSEKPILVIFDSVQRLAVGCSSKGSEPRLQVTEFMAKVEGFARGNDIAVLLTSEASRAANGGTPKADRLGSSGAESRSIEYQSDVVLCLNANSRPTHEIAEDSASPWERKVGVIVSKNRNGRDGRLPVNIVFAGPCWEMRTEPTDDAPIVQAIAQYLKRDGKTRSVEEIRKAVRRAKPAVESALAEMRKQDQVEHVMNGDRPIGWRWHPTTRTAPQSTSSRPDGLPTSPPESARAA